MRGDALVAADGIHSTVRRTLYRDEGQPAWNELMVWRGAVEYAPFLTGRSMLIAGGMKTMQQCLVDKGQRRKRTNGQQTQCPG